MTPKSPPDETNYIDVTPFGIQNFHNLDRLFANLGRSHPSTKEIQNNYWLKMQKKAQENAKEKAQENAQDAINNFGSESASKKRKATQQLRIPTTEAKNWQK